MMAWGREVAASPLPKRTMLPHRTGDKHVALQNKGHGNHHHSMWYTYGQMKSADPEFSVRMVKIVIRCAIGLVMFSYAPLAHALEVFPFYTVNQSPLVQIYGLPAADNAILLPKGKIRSMLSVDIANNFGVDQNRGNRLPWTASPTGCCSAFATALPRGSRLASTFPTWITTAAFSTILCKVFTARSGSRKGEETTPKKAGCCSSTRETGWTNSKLPMRIRGSATSACWEESSC